MLPYSTEFFLCTFRPVLFICVATSHCKIKTEKRFLKLQTKCEKHSCPMQPRNDEVQSEVHKRNDVPLQPLCSSSKLWAGNCTWNGWGTDGLECYRNWNNQPVLVDRSFFYVVLSLILFAIETLRISKFISPVHGFI